MNIPTQRRLAQLAGQIHYSQGFRSTFNLIKPVTCRIDGFSSSAAKMANLNVEIPSLKLNDGTSIPLVSTLLKEKCSRTNDRRLATEVCPSQHLVSNTSDILGQSQQ